MMRGGQGDYVWETGSQIDDHTLLLYCELIIPTFTTYTHV
jgi:hypothetical protein